MQVNMLEAKSQLSKLVKAALEGEDVVIANHGQPMVRLVRLKIGSVTRGFGALRGRLALAPDWDSAATNAAIAKALFDSPIDPAARDPTKAVDTPPLTSPRRASARPPAKPAKASRNR